MRQPTSAAATSSCAHHRGLPEQSRRTHQQHDQRDCDRHREPQFGAEKRQIGRADAFGDADDDTADDGAERTVPAAQGRSGQRIEKQRHHHGRAQEQLWRDQNRGDEADDARQSPAEHQHGFDPDADQRALVALGRRRAHGEPYAREAEEHRQHRAERCDGDADAQRILGDGDAADGPRAVGNDLEEQPLVGAPDPQGGGLEGQQNAERDDDDGFDRRPDQRTHRPAEHGDADSGGEQRANRQRHRDRDMPFHQLPSEVGGEGRHLALAEIDDAGRAIDQHQSQGERSVDAAIGDALDDVLQEQAHHTPR